MWLYVPSACSPEEPPASTSELRLLAEMCALNVMWRSTFKQPAFWQRVLKREPLGPLQFGQTSQHLMDRAFAAWLTSSSEDSPVRMSPSPESEQGSTKESAPDSGSTSAVPFATFDRHASSLRMSQDCLFPFAVEEENPSEHREWSGYSETWPNSGSMRNGTCFLRPKSARRTSGSESLSWPTPQAHDQTGGRGPNNELADGHYRPHDLVNFTKSWPTPRAEDSESCGNHPGAKDSKWATPNAHDGRRPGSDETSTQGGDLKRDAENWPTPSASMMTMEDMEQARYAGTDPRRPKYSEAWPTPAARDHKSGESLRDYGNARPLSEAVLNCPPSPQDLPTQDGQPSSENSPILRRRLNPAFVGWLMGHLPHWTNPALTNLGCGEMESYRSKLQWHLRFLLGERQGGK
jgi:hypothetical protein